MKVERSRTDIYSSHRSELSRIASLSSIRSRRTENDLSRGKDTLEITVTSLYCKLLVILGIAFPMAETLTDHVPKGFYHLFYVYLFLGSLCFLVFVYIDLFRSRATNIYKNRTVWFEQFKSKLGPQGSKGTTTPTIPTPQKSDEVQRPKNVYGSFYLRLGALLFGVGSMIYSGIEIGFFFETSIGDVDDECNNMSATLRPFLQIIFVFVQMYFIFLNLKMNVYKHKFLCRLGLMHMIATNLCVWLSVLIMETSHEIANQFHKQQFSADHLVADAPGLSGSDLDFFYESIPVPHSLVQHVMTQCHHEHNVMGDLLQNAAPFLFPCTIEYSLICAAVLYMMWKHIDEEHEWFHRPKRRRRKTRVMAETISNKDYEETHETPVDVEKSAQDSGAEDILHSSTPLQMVTFHSNGSVAEQQDQLDNERQQVNTRYHHYTVDCSRANNGLFCGIFVMVVTIITIIVFFVLIGSTDDDFRRDAITLGSATELALYTLSTIAVIIGLIQVRQLHYDSARKLELDTLLLIVAQTGVFLYSTFRLIGAFFQIEEHLLSFLGSLATIVQTILQTIFILDASSRYAYTEKLVKRKPGREIVTFLLVCNLAMWTLNSLETNRADSHPIQAKFYGGRYVWPIITHVSMPLAIFYRFHSTVCLCGIWTKTFKYRDYVFTEG